MKKTIVFIFFLFFITLILGACADSKKTPKLNATEIGRDDYLIKYDNGIILDTKQNLMWASEDNGQNIHFKSAKQYCSEFKLGGYSGWRLPKIKELRSLTWKHAKNKDSYFVSPLFKISGSIWVSDLSNKCRREYNTPTNCYSFTWGFVNCATYLTYHGTRVLPVKDLK